MKKTLIALLLVFATVSMTITSFASNDVSMIKKEQKYLVMGSVKDIEPETIVVTVDHVLGGLGNELVGKDITVAKFMYSYCDEHAPKDFNMPMVSDNVVISLDSTDNSYTVKNGAFKVDSNDHVTCRVVKHVDENDAECVKELAEVTCYIRSNARVSSFDYDSDGNIYAVYPQKPEQCVVAVDNSGNAVVPEGTEEVSTEPPVANEIPQHRNSFKKDLRWIYAIIIFVVGAGAGLLVSLLRYKRKTNINS